MLQQESAELLPELLSSEEKLLQIHSAQPAADWLQEAANRSPPAGAAHTGQV